MKEIHTHGTVKYLAIERINSANADVFRDEAEIALLPVGTIEAHGPHLPLGTDGFIVQAIAYEVAEQTGGVLLPLIPYSFSGTTRRLPGTLSIEPHVVQAYVKSVCRAAIEQGLRKILIISIHRGNDLLLPIVTSELFMEMSVPVVFINPFLCLGQEIDKRYFGGRDNAYKETALLMAALRILGMDDIVTLPVVDSDVHATTIGPLSRIRKLGSVGYEYLDRNQHIPPRANVSVEAGLDYVTLVVQEITSIAKDLDEYARIINNAAPKP